MSEDRLEEMLARYTGLVDEPGAFAAACRRGLPTMVRVNTLKTSVDRATEALDEAGIGWQARDWHSGLLALDTDSPGTTWPYFLGWLHGQEEVSAVPPVVLDPDPGDRVWDACAAPGSKTTQLAAIQGDAGRIVANDANLGRLSALRTNTERLGVTSALVTHGDARNFSFDPLGFEAFDAALVDVPCSGEGTVRKNPGALDAWKESAFDGLAGVQRAILRRAVGAVQPGGRVVYSTCTFAPEENEGVLDAVLRDGTCRIVDENLPLISSPGIREWDGREYHPDVASAHRIWPQLNDTGGFFVATLEVT
ncbi:MAG: RsmB/NOP family class I SAM-dependent RNA methyltransferase [Halobacteriales archaeon]|nr:RsmB/NOP family class I SAM-dependent RNA methyltransferase [Halobacteriales archaeon]